MATKSGKPFLTNEAQPADHWSHYTPYSQLEPFRIDPAVMGTFDPDYRDQVRGPGVFQLRDRWSLSGAGTHDGVGSPQPNAWAAPPIPPGAKSGLGYHDVARAEWSRGRFRLKTAPAIVAKRSTCRLMHECNIIALTAVKLGLRAEAMKSNQTSIP